MVFESSGFLFAEISLPVAQKDLKNFLFVLL